MRLIILLFFALLLSYSGTSQTESLSFSDAIKPHLNKYNLQSDMEFERGNVARGQFLFDSLVQNYLVGSRFNEYALKNVNGGKLRFKKIRKPIFLITYASWCLLNKGEIAALNKLSSKYSKQICFVVLFWDKKENVRKAARKFGSRINVCYANEAYKNDAQIVATLKHTLGFPTSYLLDRNRQIIDIKRGGVVTPKDTPYRNSFKLNYELFSERLDEFNSKTRPLAAA
ncbi:MAG TPA: thioredoxin family protein [Flavobacterium sp.]